MTPVTTNDSRVICRIQLSRESRWVCLALSLDDLDSANRTLVSAEALVYEIAGADDAARQYRLFHWEGGIISGARYAFRTLKTPIQQVRLHELRGQLGSGDVCAVSSAAALAVANLLSRPGVPLDLGGWKSEVDVGRLQMAEGSNHNAKVCASPAVAQTPRVEKHPIVSPRTKTNQGPQDTLAELDTTVEGSRDKGS